MRPNRRLEELFLAELLHLARELERHADLLCDLDRPVGALVRAHPSEEEEVVAAVGMDGVEREVERVGTVRDPVQVRKRLPLVHREGDEAHLRGDAVDLLVELT